MGAVAAELQSIGHRPNFFYLQHAMGLASSMGLGIALSRPELPVVVLDGDGSLLMNLGGLTTLARYRPRNLLHVVFDNESLLSVGGFPDGDVHRQRPRGDRRGGGRSAHGDRARRSTSSWARSRDALGANELTTLVAKVEAVGPGRFVTDLALLENRFQFQRHLQVTLAEGA